MNKGNKIRLIVWGVIWILTLSFGITGIVSFHNGHGVIGKIQYYLKPISKTFNNMKSITTNKIKIDSSIKKDQIIVTYNTGASISSFAFEYMEITNGNVIYTEYSSMDERAASSVIEYMLEAIAITKKHNEGDVAKKYSLSDLYNANINDGIKITSNDNITKVYINIDKSVLDTKYNPNEVIENNDNIFITEEDIVSINDVLNTNNPYSSSKGNINIYVTKENNIINIYAQDVVNTVSDNLYKSITSVVKKVTNENDYQTFINNYISLSESKSFDKFTVTLNADVSQIEGIINKDNVVKIEIK